MHEDFEQSYPGDQVPGSQGPDQQLPDASEKIFAANDNCFHDLPPGVSSGLILRVMEFERQYARQKYIKVGARLQIPASFRSANDIPEEEISGAWHELHTYMRQRGISLTACSPRVTSRHLYSFALGEMLELEISDIQVPDLIHCFIYDEFYPDPIYEATQTACQFGVRAIIEDRPVAALFHYNENNLRLNQHEKCTRDQLKEIINQFKIRFAELIPHEVTCTDCQMFYPLCYTEGNFSLMSVINGRTWVTKANWRVLLEYDNLHGYWNIREVELEELEF